MEITTGVDIIEVDRIKEAILENGEKFLYTVYTENEIEYCEKADNKNVKYQRYAARFAAKEAIYKAISNYVERPSLVLLTKMEILKEENNRPIVNIDMIRETIEFKDGVKPLKSMDISLSHIKDYAIANVVATFE